MKSSTVSIIVCASMIPSIFFAKGSDRLSAAKLKYPYSLIGNDFGILDEADLAANTCTAVPEPYSAGSTSSYWRCFDSSRVMFECDSGGRADRNEGVMGLIVLKAADSGGEYEYLARHLWPIADCKDFGRIFARKKKGSSHTCISGSEPRESSDRQGRKFTSWFFEKYKTRHGCESYFEGACDLAYQIRHGCKVAQVN